ncbi:hypothetical protein ISCGN_003300 [Ixodes scapularis]
MELSSHRAGVAVEPRRFLFQNAFGARKQPRWQVVVSPSRCFAWFRHRASSHYRSPCWATGKERNAMRHALCPPSSQTRTKKKKKRSYFCLLFEAARLACCSWRHGGFACVFVVRLSSLRTLFRFFLSPFYHGVSEVLLRICEDVYQADEASDDDDMSRSSDGD